MNKYELGVVLRADLEEENLQAEMARVKGLVERFEGNIDKVDEWGRRKLAYPIKKLTEGMYTFITFTSPAEAPREIESRLRLMENVLRFLIVRKDEAEAASPAPEKTVEPAAEAQVEAPAEEAVAEVEAPAEAEAPAAAEEPAVEEPAVEEAPAEAEVAEVKEDVPEEPTAE